jgi:hypothetical protein
MGNREYYIMRNCVIYTAYVVACYSGLDTWFRWQKQHMM